MGIRSPAQLAKQFFEPVPLSRIAKMAAPPPPLPRRDRPPLPMSTAIERTFSPPEPQQVFSPPPASPPPADGSLLIPDLCHGTNFGSCLQLSYEAISKRHEEELRALESLRGHIFKRQRADKEYAEQLLRINQVSERSSQFSSSTTSAIIQVIV